MTSSLALETIKATTVVLAWVLNLMCLTGCSLCTHAAQILQLTRGARGLKQSPGMTTLPFLRHPFVVPTPPPPLSAAPSRWLTLQPAEVNCAEGAAPLHPSPRVRSRDVNQRLFIAGTLSCPGSQPSLAPSVPGLWQRQRCQGGFPLTCCTPRAIWARPEAGDRSITLESGDDEEALCTSTVNLSEWADTADKLKWMVKLHLNYHSILRVKCKLDHHLYDSLHNWWIQVNISLKPMCIAAILSIPMRGCYRLAFH